MTIDLSQLADKTKQAVDEAEFGAADILGDLADVNSRDEAQDFVKRHAPLLFPPGQDPASDVLEYAPQFRKAWVAKTPAEFREVNEFLNEVFVAGISARTGLDSWPKNSIKVFSKKSLPALRADFQTGKFQPIPRTLLEVLAIELIESRRRLKRCERPECQRHFVKQHPRHRYCSAFCSEDMRMRYLKDWALEHRDELKEQRARRRKKGGNRQEGSGGAGGQAKTENE